MEPLWQWIEGMRVAALVGQSPLLSGALSAVHLIGFTLITGGALVANLRSVGVLLADRPVHEIVRPAARGVTVGLAISVITGFLLFAPRAAEASANGIFQAKMLLLALAVVFHATLQRAAIGRSLTPTSLRAIGVTGLLLWGGVALAGSAFILLEG